LGPCCSKLCCYKKSGRSRNGSVLGLPNVWELVVRELVVWGLVVWGLVVFDFVVLDLVVLNLVILNLVVLNLVVLNFVVTKSRVGLGKEAFLGSSTSA
jgi:hypothetical protein